MMDIAKLYRESFVENDFERIGLFADLQNRFNITSALYPGSFVHITPSFFFDDVVYVDSDRKARRFFESPDLEDFIFLRKRYSEEPKVRFIPADYTQPLDLQDESFDLLISQYAGPISVNCKRYLKMGGLLLANNSHADAGLAALDEGYKLVGVYIKREKGIKFGDANLESYFIPRKGVEVTRELLTETGRGMGYTKTASSYLFKKTSNHST